MRLNYLTDKKLVNHENNSFFHGFFTRNGGVSKKNFSSLNCAFINGEKSENVVKNRDIACQRFLSKNSYRLIILNQVHSNKIINIDENKKFSSIDADGMITSSSKVILGILTADCAPIIFYGKKYVGIIHAGWKGLVNGIVSKIIFMLKRNGELERNIACSVGPHLKKNSFEVKQDFVKKLLEKSEDYSLFLSFKSGRIFFDSSQFIASNLRANGIQKISISNLDTFTNPSLFFSYRKNMKLKKECGRQISVVGIK